MKIGVLRITHEKRKVYIGLKWQMLNVKIPNEKLNNKELYKGRE